MSYRYITRRNIQRRWGKTEIARKKKLIEFPLEYAEPMKLKEFSQK
jgi:hypothetical protein